MIQIFHLGTDHVAFLYDEVPHPADKIMSEHAVLLDGSRPVSGHYVYCGTCGEVLTPADLYIPAAVPGSLES